MYAIIQTGGKQYKVSAGDVIYIEKLDQKADEAVEFTDVLAVSGDSGLITGDPIVKGAKVKGKLVKNGKQKKVVVFKF